MRALRYLFLLGAAATAFFVYRDYQSSRQVRESFRIAEPERLAEGVASRSGQWSWEQSTGDQSRIVVAADGFRQGGEDDAIALSGVELRIYRGEDRFDRVRTPDAVFDVAANQLRSQAQTVITLGVPVGETEQEGDFLTRIETERATFDTLSGSARTETRTQYYFDNGSASSDGAYYDSNLRYFEMTSDAEVIRRPGSPTGSPTIIRAGKLIYEETDSRVDLRDGARMARGSQQLDAASAVIRLENGKLRSVYAADAVGEDRGEARTLRFQTPSLDAYYGPNQALEQVVGQGRSALWSETATSTIHAQGDHVDLHYRPNPDGGDSLLEEATLRGDAEIVSSAKQANGVRREVRSSALLLAMGPDGENLERIETLDRGSLELVPANGGVRRRLEADRILAYYAAGNRLRRLEARGAVALHSEGGGSPPLDTWSDLLEATLDPASGEIETFRQQGGFRFERAGRSGRSELAVWQPAAETLEMEGRAEVLDAEGRLRGHKITMADGADEIRAQGDVSSVYSTEDETAAEGIFESGEPIYATAATMQSDDATGELVYAGQARMWQGRNRIEADRIRIDRKRRRLVAEGKVFTLFEEGSEPDESESAEQPLSEIRAQRLEYDEATRTAVYTGRARLERSDFVAVGDRLTAVLAGEDDPDGGLESAVAVGNVQILVREDGRTATGDRAELDPATDVVIISGAPAIARNLLGEETKGERLTYSAADGSLLVSGGDARAETLRRRKR